MHPVLFKIPWGGGLEIHSYGVMVALGFLAALAWIRYQAPRAGLPAGKMLDFAFWMMVSAIVGSRLAFLIVEWRYYLAHPAAALRVWEGGLVFYGGLLACIWVAWVYLKRHALNFWKVADVFMPGVALGHSLGRIGCFLAGCCYGRTCDPHAWYALHFPTGEETLAPGGLPLYPTQWIESAANLLIFLFLAWRSRKKAFDGQILLLYLITYSILRIAIELLRGDQERGFVIGHWLSTSQFLSGLLLVTALFVLFYRRGRDHESN
ncbi:MAG TPA: prolipoprotein diacylglyceryl transferase [Deltaproteobacteria bacterium]|nr:prolipoprotein diacylglyceryl transferase [Deltaproteobacteria bacterium]